MQILLDDQKKVLLTQSKNIYNQSVEIVEKQNSKVQEQKVLKTKNTENKLYCWLTSS